MFVLGIAWRRAFGYLLVCAAVVLPWIIRNELQLGAPVLNTANGFNVAAVYSNEAHDTGGFVDAVFDPRFDDLRQQQLDEVEWDAALRRRGLDGLKQHPLDVVHVIGGSTLAYLEIKPWQSDGAELRDGTHKNVRRLALPAFYAVTTAGIWGLWIIRRSRTVQLVIASAAYFTITSIVFVGVPGCGGRSTSRVASAWVLLVDHVVKGRRGRKPEVARPHAGAHLE